MTLCTQRHNVDGYGMKVTLHMVFLEKAAQGRNWQGQVSEEQGVW